MSGFFSLVFPFTFSFLFEKFSVGFSAFSLSVSSLYVCCLHWANCQVPFCYNFEFDKKPMNFLVLKSKFVGWFKKTYIHGTSALRTLYTITDGTSNACTIYNRCTWWWLLKINNFGFLLAMCTVISCCRLYKSEKLSFSCVQFFFIFSVSFSKWYWTMLNFFNSTSFVHL